MSSITNIYQLYNLPDHEDKIYKPLQCVIVEVYSILTRIEMHEPTYNLSLWFTADLRQFEP